MFHSKVFCCFQFQNNISVNYNIRIIFTYNATFIVYFNLFLSFTVQPSACQFFIQGF